MTWLRPADRRPSVCRAGGGWAFVAMLAIAVATWVGSASRRAVAEEPYRQFLEKLRQEQLFDLALVYLDGLEKNQSADAAFAVEIPLERARLFQGSALTMGLQSPQRAARLDDAKNAFERFLEQNKNHPRRSEARMGLGNLLLARGEETRAAGDPKQAKPEAVKYFGEALKLFDSTMKELEATLKQMQGARIDAGDEEKKALRDKYRGEYRQAELLTAYATEQMGRSYATGSPEWKKELEQAQKLYTELYEHERDRLETRNYALFYRSGIQRDLGKSEDAADGYNRILDLEGIDELRPLQFKALTELVKLWSSTEQGKAPAALDLAAKWEKQVRPDERTMQDVIDFQLATAAARKTYAEALQAKDSNDRSIIKLRKEARDTLLKLVRISGPHQHEARELMASLGITKERVSEPVELPKVKNYEEAVKEANSRIEQMQTEQITKETLQQELDKATDDAKKKEFGDQLADVDATLARLSDQSGELLKVALRMFPPGGEPSELLETRYRLAYVELQRGNAWDAIAIGQFLAHTNAGSDTGLKCATVALAGYGKLITEADPELQKVLVDGLQPLAEFMVQTWPNSSEAQAAASTLVQLAMNAGDIAKARSYLDKLPTGTGKSDTLRRDIGLVLAGQYFHERSALPTGTAPSPELISKRDNATELLATALKGLRKEELDARFIEAINSLVRLQLASGKSEEANRWIADPDLSPVRAIQANPNLVSDRLVKLDSYRTALQAAVGQLGKGGAEGEGQLKKIEELVEQLRSLAGSDAEGQQLLTSIFVKVARDLQELVEGADSPATRQKLAEGMALLCRQIAANSDDFETKFWAGQTLSRVAAALDDSAKQTKTSLSRESVALLEGIIAKEEQSPGWIKVANGDLIVRMSIAKAMRESGQYSKAIEQLSKLLAKNPRMLDLQIEAAEVFQAWGDSGATEKYQEAIYGGVADSKGVKAVWGWGKLSQALAGRKELADKFFLCRYQLALSLFRSAVADKDAAAKTKTLGQAEREITATVLLYPDLGGDDSKQRFDTLLKNIQKELGKEPTGLPAKKA